jgi:hypothetical protein
MFSSYLELCICDRACDVNGECDNCNLAAIQTSDFDSLRRAISLDLAGTSSDTVFLMRHKVISGERAPQKMVSGEHAPQKMVSGTTGVLTRVCWSLESRQSLESSETTGISSRFS